MLILGTHRSNIILYVFQPSRRLYLCSCDHSPQFVRIRLEFFPLLLNHLFEIKFSSLNNKVIELDFFVCLLQKFCLLLGKKPLLFLKLVNFLETQFNLPNVLVLRFSADYVCQPHQLFFSCES